MAADSGRCGPWSAAATPDQRCSSPSSRRFSSLQAPREEHDLPSRPVRRVAYVVYGMSVLRRLAHKGFLVSQYENHSHTPQRPGKIADVDRRHPCVCCEHLTLDEPLGSYDICSVCFWEDDLVQLRWPDYSGGANKPCLIEAQRAFGNMGACESRLLAFVRPPSDNEPREQGWRPADPEVDNFESRGEEEKPWPDDATALYWWRPTFWRDPQP